MVDASWDNGSHAVPTKAGMPLWGKIMLGCGLVAGLAIATCVGAIAWGFNKVSTVGKEQWPHYLDTVKALRSPAATKALYDANPRLKRQFLDSDAFEWQVAEWRPAIQQPPVAMPAITSGRAISFIGKDTRVGGKESQGHHGSAVTGYRMEDGRFLMIVWEDGQVIEIKFEGHPTNRVQSDAH